MISEKFNFLFIHIPKTAGNSVQGNLVDFSEDRLVCLHENQDGVDRFGIVSEKYKTKKHYLLMNTIKNSMSMFIEDCLSLHA